MGSSRGAKDRKTHLDFFFFQLRKDEGGQIQMSGGKPFLGRRHRISKRKNATIQIRTSTVKSRLSRSEGVTRSSF